MLGYLPFSMSLEALGIFWNLKSSKWSKVAQTFQRADRVSKVANRCSQVGDHGSRDALQALHMLHRGKAQTVRGSSVVAASLVRPCWSRAGTKASSIVSKLRVLFQYNLPPDSPGISFRRFPPFYSRVRQNPVFAWPAKECDNR
jgi:hypothetical protein